MPDTTMATKTPSTLPVIDAIEVVSLRGLNPNHVDEYMAVANEARRIRIAGAGAQRIAELWRTLPEGEQARCHLPPFGLKFYAEGILVCQASICWRCNNIFGETGGDRLFFAFEGSAAPSRELLKECEAALGESTTE
jgi:hypothetical protein